MTRPVPVWPRPSLEFHRKQAKALQAALTAADPAALERARAQHPRFEPARQWTLADAQLIHAREHGFSSWPKFQKRVLELQAEGRRSAVLIEAAVARIGNHRVGDLARAREVLAADPGSARSDLYAACAMGDAEAVADALREEPESAVRPGGPWDWPPLLYLCFSRFLPLEPNREPAFVATARLLLDGGADPNAYWLLGEEPHQERETALYGAAGCGNSPGLTRLLLENGADPDDGEVAYHSPEFAGMAAGRVWWEWNNRPEWRATALLRAIDGDHLDDVRWLLEHGADPQDRAMWANAPLHQAIVRGRRRAFVETVLEFGADPSARRKDGASAYRLAGLMARPDVLHLLEPRIDPEKLDAGDRLLAACARSNPAEARRIAAESPGLAAGLPGWYLPAAAGAGNTEAVRLMLDAGFDVETLGDYRATPLHHAAWEGRLETARLLVERGASLTAVNGFGGTPLDAAVFGAAHYQRDSDWVALVEFLIAAGSDVRQVGPYPSGNPAVNAVLARYGAAPRGGTSGSA